MSPTFRRPGLVCTDRFLDVPLDHADPGGATIEIYAREVVAPGREGDDLPWLLFLQGGPGRPRPPGLSGSAARPARNGPQHGGEPADPARRPRGGRPPSAPLPRGLDRAGRRTAAPRPGRRPALERPGAELRRLLRRHL